MSFSPCSRFSLTAEPLPAPPPIQQLPRDLVRTVQQHPEIFKIQTTLDVQVFEKLLTSHPNQPFVRSVVRGFRAGFWPFAATPYPKTVNESYNSTKKPEYRKFLQEQRDIEINNRRFSNAIGPRLFPGMTCMPVHVVRRGQKLRAIYDHSAGEYSLNSLIPEEARAVKLDGIKHLSYVLRHARSPGITRDIVLFKSDVSSAYRIMPMSPYWQALQAVKIDGKYYVDRCNTFGNAASQTLFCAFFSLVLWIAENVFRIPDILSYIDDNFSWEYRDKMRYYKPYAKMLPEKQTKLLMLWDILGIPHDAKKQEYGHEIKIIGYEIDVKRMQVTIPKESMNEILSKIETLCSTATDETDIGIQDPCYRPIVTVQDIRRITGKVNWAIEVNPLLKPGVDGLHRLLAGKIDPTEPCNIDKDTRQELLWLANHLRNAKGVSLKTTMPWTADKANQTVYAYTSRRGIGFWCPKSKLGCVTPFTSELASDHESERIFHSLIAIICVIEWAQRGYLSTTKNAKRLLIYVESKSDTAITAFKTRRAPAGMNHIFRFAMSMLLESKIDLHVDVTPEGNEEQGKVARMLARQKTASPLMCRPEIRISEYRLPAKLAKKFSEGVRVPNNH